MLKDQIAWVIGATGAIGAAVAADLANAGAQVIVSGRNREALGKLPYEAFPVDLSSRESVDAVARSIEEKYGRIDILVNSAALSTFGDFLELSDEDWLSVLQAKGVGYMRSIRAVLPGMLERGKGNIVNVSGRGGHQPSSASHLPGSSANAMVNLLTRGIANLYGKRGIRINAVAPGPVKTPRYDSIAAANAKLGKVEASANICTTQQVADVVRFLVSEQSAQLNGTILQVDGGSTPTL